MPPPNDDLVNATVLTGTRATVNGTVVGATVDVPYDPINDNLGAGASVWYKIPVPAEWTDVTINFLDDAPGDPLQLWLFTASVYPPTSNGDISGAFITQVGTGQTTVPFGFIDGLTPDGFIYVGVGSSFPGADEKTFAFEFGFSIPFTGEGRFVAVGQDPNFSKTTMVSDDGGVTWFQKTSPFDDNANYGLGVAPTADRLLATSAIGSPDPESVAESLDDGDTWAGLSTPFDGATCQGVFYAAALARAYLVGFDSLGAGQVARGVLTGGSFAWTTLTHPLDGGVYAGVYMEARDRVVIVGSTTTGTDSIATSDDGGDTWTPRGNPLAFAFSILLAVAYSPELDRLVIAGTDFSGTNVLATSDDGGETWTLQGNPFSGATQANGVAWSSEEAQFVAVANSGDPVATSPDGLTWMTRTAPLATLYGVAYGEGTWVVVGCCAGDGKIVITSTDGGLTWTAQTSPLDGTAPFAATGYAVCFIPPPEPPCPPVVRGRFFEAPPWRFVVTDLCSVVQTILDPRATDRRVVYTLNQPAVATMDVPCDDPEINIEALDGDPFVAMGNRLVFGFRRDGACPNPPWTCRYAGILMQPNDENVRGADVPLSHLTAFDPWMYWNSRPVLNEFGLLPGSKGLTFTDQEPQAIVKALLVNASLGGPTGGPPCSVSGPSGPDQLFVDYGQTAFYGGNIDTVSITPTITINFRQGMMVGEALTQLVGTGACDILLVPIWDPVNRPGLCVEVNVYKLAGTQHPEAIFSWDEPGRSLVGLGRLENGQRIMNHPQFYAGQGGTPVAVPTSGAGDASLAKYGPYWGQEFFPGYQSFPAYVAAVARARLDLQAAGKKTVTITPAPEFAPLLFDEYFLGDQVPVYASRRFRAPIRPTLTSTGWIDFHRIYQIPVAIPDDAPEQVEELLLQSPFEES